MSGVVESVMGIVRPVRRRWEDGTAACPFCDYPCDRLDLCQNPGCEAGPTATPGIVLARRRRAINEAAAVAERERVRRIRERMS